MPSCARQLAVDLMGRNAISPNRVEVINSDGTCVQYSWYDSGAAAHREYLRVIGNCRRMRSYGHVRLYIGCEMKAERRYQP